MLCREAQPAERRELERANGGRLRRINHLEDAHQSNAPVDTNVLPDHLTIILRATAQLDAFPEAKAAFIRAAQNWENLIKSPVTIYIDVDYGPNNLEHRGLRAFSAPPVRQALAAFLINRFARI
jgi:hypothetical protein